MYVCNNHTHSVSETLGNRVLADPTSHMRKWGHTEKNVEATPSVSTERSLQFGFGPLRLGVAMQGNAKLNSYAPTVYASLLTHL